MWSEVRWKERRHRGNLNLKSGLVYKYISILENSVQYITLYTIQCILYTIQCTMSVYTVYITPHSGAGCCKYH